MEQLLKNIQIIYNRKINIEKSTQDELLKNKKKKLINNGLLAKRDEAIFPAGLENTINSCYANSLTQLFAQIPEIEYHLNNKFPSYAKLIKDLKEVDEKGIIFQHDICDIAMKNIGHIQSQDDPRSTFIHITDQIKEIPEIMVKRLVNNIQKDLFFMDINADKENSNIQEQLEDIISKIKKNNNTIIFSQYLFTMMNTTGPIVNTKINNELKIEEDNYNLIGAILHRGETQQGGHYISIKKINNIWYEINDSFVIEISDINKYIQNIEEKDKASKRIRIVLYKKI